MEAVLRLRDRVSRRGRRCRDRDTELEGECASKNSPSGGVVRAAQHRAMEFGEKPFMTPKTLGVIIVVVLAALVYFVWQTS